MSITHIFEPSYCFDDVLMKPLISTVKTRNDISLNVNIASGPRTLTLKTPLISSPMDTVTETDMAIKMALIGGLGIIHRFNTIQTQVEQVRKVKRYLQYIIPHPYTFKSYDTYSQLVQKRAELGISSFCIVNDDGLLEDIITNRDLKYSSFEITEAHNTNPHITIADIQSILAHAESATTPDNDNHRRREVAFITLTEAEFNTSMQYIDDMRKIIKRAKEIMMARKFEKIPICTPSKQLIGLITWKNIMHFYANETAACLDKHGRLCVGAAIGIVGDYMDRLSALIDIGVDLICVDVANGFNSHVLDTLTTIRAKYPTLVIMAGNVCEAAGFHALAQTGIDCIRVGIGNGSICTTRAETGIGFGQFSAVNECYDMVISHALDVKIICDGGSLGKTGNKVKALASGTSAIMLGRTLASTEEAPGQVIIRNGKRFKYVRGMASTMANISKQEASTNGKINTKFTAEGVDGEQEMTGSVADIIEQINGGLKSGLSYLGAYNIEQVHLKRRANEIKFCITTAIGMTESGIRVKTY